MSSVQLRDPEAIEIVDSSALGTIMRAEVDIQVATARRFPRSLTKFKQNALTMATLDADIAGQCFYVLPRGGKIVEGPGVRLAEIVSCCWGNLRSQSRIVDEDKRFVTAQGVAWDMENNVLNCMEVKRRITDRDNRTYSDDMIGVTGNAAASIAFRNAIWKVVPFVYVLSIYREARKVALGDARTLVQRRQLALEWFLKLGVTEAQVLTLLKKPGVEDITLEDLGILTGTKTAILEETTTVEEVFKPEAKAGTISFGNKKKPASAQQSASASAAHAAGESTESSPPPDADVTTDPASSIAAMTSNADERLRETEAMEARAAARDAGPDETPEQRAAINALAEDIRKAEEAKAKAQSPAAQEGGVVLKRPPPDDDDDFDFGDDVNPVTGEVTVPDTQATTPDGAATPELTPEEKLRQEKLAEKERKLQEGREKGRKLQAERDALKQKAQAERDAAEKGQQTLIK